MFQTFVDHAMVDMCFAGEASCVATLINVKLERKGARIKPAGDISIFVVKHCCLVLPESLSAQALFCLAFRFVSLMIAWMLFGRGEVHGNPVHGWMDGHVHRLD